MASKVNWFKPEKSEFKYKLRKEIGVLRYLDLKYIGKYFVSHGLLTIEELSVLLREQNVDKLTMDFVSIVDRKPNLENSFRLAVVSARNKEGPKNGMDSICESLFGVRGDDLRPLPGVVIAHRDGLVEACRKEQNLHFSLFLPQLCTYLDESVALHLCQLELDISVEECGLIHEKLRRDRLRGVLDLVMLLKSKGPDAFWSFYDSLKAMVDNADGPHLSLTPLLEEIDSYFKKGVIRPVGSNLVLMDLSQYNTGKKPTDQIPTDAEFEEISMIVDITLDTNWPHLAENLSLSKSVISKIAEDDTLVTVKDKIYECLKIWRKKGSRWKTCTKSALAEALRKVDLVHVSRQLLSEGQV
jgi:hypothetical protein